MGDKENMGFPCALYYGKDLKELQPLDNVVLSDVSLQSEEETVKWDNVYCQTMTIDLSCQAHQNAVWLFKCNLPRLPRKLKKRVKRDYFVGDVRKIGRWDLIYAYCLNNPHKTAWLKGWDVKIN